MRVSIDILTLSIEVHLFTDEKNVALFLSFVSVIQVPVCLAEVDSIQMKEQNGSNHYMFPINVEYCSAAFRFKYTWW